MTATEVLAAKARLEAAIPGWQRPHAHALGVAIDDQPITWLVTNYPNRHELPGVVLATVLGHCAGSATYWLDVDQLDRAIEMLAPAGACSDFDHPNLWAWQKLRSEIPGSSLPPGHRIVVVFLASEASSPDDDAQRQLRAALDLGPPR